jgi:hypothetical protein
MHGHCSASVTVPTVNSYFTSIIDFTMVSHLEYDAVLGADGLGYVGPLVLIVFSQLSAEAS